MKKWLKLVHFSFAILLNSCASGYKKINPETINYAKYWKQYFARIQIRFVKKKYKRKKLK
jgi:hypothetical protein